MSESLLWIILVVVLIQLGVSLLTYQKAGQAPRGDGAAAPQKVGRSEREAGRKLAEAARALHAKVQSLPPTILGPGGDGRVRGAVLWSAADVAALKPGAGGEEAHGKVAAALAWLLQQAESVRATPRGSAQYLIDFPHDTWGRSYKEATDGLQALITQGEMVSGEGKGA